MSGIIANDTWTAGVRAALQPIRWIDHALLAHYGIVEYTNDPSCLLRAALTRSPSTLTLCDGTRVEQGVVVAELHLWNERAMTVFRSGPSIRAGIELRRRMARSLMDFASFASRHERFGAVDAILVRTSACEQFPRESFAKIAHRWGFEIEEHRPCTAERFAEFWDNVYLALLGAAYPSAAPLRNVRRRMERLRIWTSRARLFAFARAQGGMK